MNMTMQIVKKDLVYLVTSVKSAVFMAIILCVCMPFINLAMGVAIPALLGYILIYSAMAYEERSKVELINATLPVTRKQLCRARYIESIIYLVGGILISLIGTVLYLFSQLHFEVSGVIQILPIIVVAALVAGSIYNGIILPILFNFGTIKARYYLMFSYIIIFIMANGIASSELSEGIIKLLEGSQDYLLLIGLLVAVVIQYISYEISLKIWNKKDFK